jgi:hypothetical protein
VGVKRARMRVMAEGCKGRSIEGAACGVWRGAENLRSFSGRSLVATGGLFNAGVFFHHWGRYFMCRGDPIPLSVTNLIFRLWL